MGRCLSPVCIFFLLGTVSLLPDRPSPLPLPLPRKQCDCPRSVFPLIVRLQDFPYVVKSTLGTMPGHVIIPTIILFFILVTIEAFILRLKLHMTYMRAFSFSFLLLLISCVLVGLAGWLGFFKHLGGISSFFGPAVLWLVWWLFAREDFPPRYTVVLLIIVILLLLMRITFGFLKLDGPNYFSIIILLCVLPFGYSGIILGLLLKRFYAASIAWLITNLNTSATLVLSVVWLACLYL